MTMVESEGANKSSSQRESVFVGTPAAAKENARLETRPEKKPKKRRRGGKDGREGAGLGSHA